MILLEAIHNHSVSNPDKIAVIDGQHEITYSQLWSNILRAATYYNKVAHRGDRIILSASKSLDFVYSYFGAHLAGVITIPVDSTVNEIRLQRIINSASPIGIYGKLFLDEQKYQVKPFPNLEDEGEYNYVLPDDNDIADILYTTGTTGFPKGVVLTHYNEYCSATNINEFIGNTENEIELLALPISHSFGLGRLRCTMLKGATLDLLGSFAAMKKFYREIENRHITGFGMVPASWNYIKKMSGERIARYAGQINYIEIGSAPMSLEDKQLLIHLFPNTRVCMHYGLTEASRSCFICFNEEQNHLDSVGKPTPNVDIKIFNSNGLEVANSEEGEICVKGGNVCSDYWGDDKPKYKESFFDDYFRTGDWGFKDIEGYFHLVSRKKELINIGGKKLSPIEVEEVIDEIDGVEESACVGVHNDVLGEVAKVFVVRNSPTITEEVIKDVCKAKLEGYKVPVYVDFIDEIPKTSSGKIQRLLLK